MKIIVEIQKLQDNKIAAIYMPALEMPYTFSPPIPIESLQAELTSIYSQVIENRDLLRKLIAFDDSNYVEENKLLVIGDIPIENGLGCFSLAMPWLGRTLLLTTFLVVSVNSFLAIVSQGDTNNSGTILAIIGIILSFITLPVLYKYSRADEMYQSIGMKIEDIGHNLFYSEQSVFERTGALCKKTANCTINGSSLLIGSVFVVAIVSFIVQYLESSNGLISLNESAASNNAPSIPTQYMPFLSVLAGLIVAINKTAVEGSFLYRAAKSATFFKRNTENTAGIPENNRYSETAFSADTESVASETDNLTITVDQYYNNSYGSAHYYLS